MFLPKTIKFAFFLAIVFCLACGVWQTADNKNGGAAKISTANEKSREIPFSTKEPNVYQAEIVLTSYANGEKQEREIFTARSGAKSRCDFADQISSLRTGDNRSFLIDKGGKIYAEIEKDSAGGGETGDSIKDFLTVEWLNEKPGATFEKLETDGNLTKYRARFAAAQNANSEIFVYVDENLQMPVKQEFYSTNGEQKTLMFSMEMRNLRLEADDKLFELPKDFRKVSLSEFQKLRRERLN